MRTQFPVVQRLLLERVHETLKDRQVSIFFDASKVNFLLEAAMCRFLNEELMPTQLCFGVCAVPKSVDAKSLQMLLRRHLLEAGIEMKNVVCAISDSGPPNPTAMKDWNDTVRSAYVGSQLVNETLFWVPCLMHAFSNCGTVLRKRLPRVKQFMSGFKRMTNTSDAARKLWSDLRGFLPRTGREELLGVVGLCEENFGGVAEREDVSCKSCPEDAS